MEYNSIIAAVPKSWKKKMCAANQEKEDETNATKLTELLEKKKWSQTVYNMFNETTTTMIEIHKKWQRVCADINIDRIERAIKFIFSCINSVKMISFQFRLLHNAILLNNRLVHTGIVDTKLCSNCQEQTETPMHFFVECNIAKKLIADVENYIMNTYGREELNDASLRGVDVLLNLVQPNNMSILNLGICIIKQKLYSYKCLGKKINKEVVIEELEFIHKTDKKLVTGRSQIAKYNSR